MKKIVFMVIALIGSVSIHAGEIDGSAVLGSALGAAAGSAIGSASGGRSGAIIGGGAGGAIGAAIGSNQGSNTRVVNHREIYYKDDRGYHKGHHKHHGHRD